MIVRNGFEPGAIRVEARSLAKIPMHLDPGNAP